jgi:alanyl-tRNA synthetase
MTRVSFIAGRRALRDSRLLRNNADIISRNLKTPVTETAKGVLDLLDRMNRMDRKIKVLEEAAARIRAEALLQNAGIASAPEAGKGLVLVESFSDADIEEVLRIGRSAQKLTDAALILLSLVSLKFAAFCSQKGGDVRPLVKEALEAWGGRGGGGPSFFQGSFTSQESLCAFGKAISAQTRTKV